MQTLHPIKIANLVQKHKSSRKLTYLGVKIALPVKDIQSSAKLLISVCENCVYRSKTYNRQKRCLSRCKKIAKVLNKSREKMVHFDLRQTENCVSRKLHYISLSRPTTLGCTCYKWLIRKDTFVWKIKFFCFFYFSWKVIKIDLRKNFATTTVYSILDITLFSCILYLLDTSFFRVF